MKNRDDLIWLEEFIKNLKNNQSQTNKIKTKLKFLLENNNLDSEMNILDDNFDFLLEELKKGENIYKKHPELMEIISNQSIKEDFNLAFDMSNQLSKFISKKIENSFENDFFINENNNYQIFSINIQNILNQPNLSYRNSNLISKEQKISLIRDQIIINSFKVNISIEIDLSDIDLNGIQVNIKVFTDLNKNIFDFGTLNIVIKWGDYIDSKKIKNEGKYEFKNIPFNQLYYDKKKQLISKLNLEFEFLPNSEL